MRKVHAVFDYEVAPGVVVQFAQDITPTREIMYNNTVRDTNGLRLVGTWPTRMSALEKANWWNSFIKSRKGGARVPI